MSEAAAWVAAAIALLSAVIATWQAVSAKSQADSAKEQVGLAKQQVEVAEKQAVSAESSATTAQEELELLRQQHAQQEVQKVQEQKLSAYNALQILGNESWEAVKALDHIKIRLEEGNDRDDLYKELDAVRDEIRAIWYGLYVPVRAHAGSSDELASALYRRIRDSHDELENRLSSYPSPDDAIRWLNDTLGWIEPSNYRLIRESSALVREPSE